jgi:hypothetical protein
MKRRKDECIGSLIKQYLREEGLESPLNEFRLLSSWALVMGNGVERQTGKLYIKNEVLFVEIKLATLRADLMLQRSDVVKKLNAEAGAHVIKDINFI